MQEALRRASSRAARGLRKYSIEFFSCMLAFTAMGDQGIGTRSLLKRRHFRWRTSVNLDSSSNSGRRYAVYEETRSQEMGMSNMIRLVAVAMLAILVGCGGGKKPAATKAS